MRDNLCLAVVKWRLDKQQKVSAGAERKMCQHVELRSLLFVAFVQSPITGAAASASASSSSPNRPGTARRSFGGSAMIPGIGSVSTGEEWAAGHSEGVFFFHINRYTSRTFLIVRLPSVRQGPGCQCPILVRAYGIYRAFSTAGYHMYKFMIS